MTEPAKFSLMRAKMPLGASRDQFGAKHPKLDRHGNAIMPRWWLYSWAHAADTYDLGRRLDRHYEDPYCCITAALPVRKSWDYVEFSTWGNGQTFIKPTSSRLLVIDLDGAVVPGFDPMDPVSGIRSILFDLGLNSAAMWCQITGSQKPWKDSPARLRLLGILAYPLVQDRLTALLSRWKRQFPHLAVDTTSGQLSRRHYTSRPSFVDGVVDPLPRRTFLIEGEPVVKVVAPKLAEAGPGALAAAHNPDAPLSQDMHEAIVQLAYAHGVDGGIADAVSKISKILLKSHGARLRGDPEGARAVLEGNDIKGAVRWVRHRLGRAA